MSKQNIYDNETFFAGYKGIRDNKNNENNLFEIPTLFSLLPNLNDKTILDLGCGFGEHCKEFVNLGAKKVVGIDISKKMLEVARKENSDERIAYLEMAMEDIDSVEDSFDVVVSSLAFHYIKDFSSIVKAINRKLNSNGVFVFSQETPLSTCHSSGSRWTKDENGKKIYLNLYNYGIEGERESSWFVDGVKKYHRMFSTIINSLVENGFAIDKMVEPIPDDKMLKEHPEYYDLLLKPDFLIVKCHKIN